VCSSRSFINANKYNPRDYTNAVNNSYSNTFAYAFTYAIVTDSFS
jgi:hypothetical protein